MRGVDFDQPGEVVVRKWARGATSGRDRQEIHLVRTPSGLFRVRRVGPVITPDSAPTSELQALVAIRRAMGEGWREVPVSHPPIRYGGPGQWTDRPDEG